jgi:hypothetical protein
VRAISEREPTSSDRLNIVTVVGLSVMLSVLANPSIMAVIGHSGRLSCDAWVGAFHGFPLVQYRSATISSGGDSTLYILPLLVNIAAWAVVVAVVLTVACRLFETKPVRIALVAVMSLTLLTSTVVVLNDVISNTGRSAVGFVVDDPALQSVEGEPTRWSPNLDATPTRQRQTC